MESHKQIEILFDVGDTVRALSGIEVLLGRLSYQCRECAMAVRTKEFAELDEPDRRRVIEIQKSIFKALEELEERVKKFRASLHIDGDADAEVVPRPVDSGGHPRLGSAAGEIDDFIQRDPLYTRPERPKDGSRVVVAVAPRIQGEGRCTSE